MIAREFIDPPSRRLTQRLSETFNATLVEGAARLKHLNGRIAANLHFHFRQFARLLNRLAGG